MARDKTDKTDTTPVATPATRRKVRGLMEYWEAIDSGEEWEFEAPSAVYIPGMGLGATAQATRWAWLGLQAELANAVKLAAKRPAHRPQIHPYQSKDAYRAFASWQMCAYVREQIGNPDAKIRARELIRLVSYTENLLGVSKHQRTFTSDDRVSEQSVSRGKAILKIDENWKSEVCEELWRSISQTT